EVIIRRTKYDLRKAQERSHILEGLKIALDFIDEVIAILRASKDQASGKAALIERFGLDEIQAQAIVQMRLGQLTGLEREKIESELAEIKEKIADYLDILSNETRVLEIVKTEAMKIRDKFGDDRLTEIANISGEVDIEDLIPVEDCIYTLTNRGYIKRQPVDTYTLQNRGGKGVKGMTRREEDFAEIMFKSGSHDYIMFFSNKGKAYRLKGYEIPEGSRTSKGMNIVNLLPIEGDEKITAMIDIQDLEKENQALVMITRKGIIKRTPLDAYKNLRKSGIIAINLDDDDELAWVQLTDGESDVIVSTKDGMSIRFNEQDARVLGRTARGVKAITLREGDEVVGMAVAKENMKMLTITETGYGRLSDISNYRLQSRGGKGVKNYKTDKYGLVASVNMVDDSNDLIIISSDGIMIRIPASQINTVARGAKGVRVMRVNENERIVSVVAVAHDEEETSELPEQTAEDAEQNDNTALSDAEEKAEE
ncbi:MAG: DNA gyrase C-terminal beta-propeller domain-containing protein, partial [Acutalibacteraceae bacterium]